MQRIATRPRPNWQQKVEEKGLTFHTPGGTPYWNESAYYRFNAQQIDILEAAANECHTMCIEAATNVVDNERWEELGIPEAAIPAILRSWERDDFSLYGRFDFSYDGVNPPKMLEYNADTPTSLVEAAVVQWFWLQDKFPNADQFNSIHEKLIAAWKTFKAKGHERIVHLGGVKENDEDFRNVQYIADTCHQAGLETKQLFIEDIGWNEGKRRFVDLDENTVTSFFKLYPWEWMFHEAFWIHFQDEDPGQFIEPAWKALLSNKGLLPILWELYPNHPYLLPAFYDAAELKNSGYVKKPKLSREGANIEIHDATSGIPLKIVETQGEYGEEGFVYQGLAKLPSFDGNHPVCGVWVVNHESCGLGVREDNSLVTGNLSRFVPHIFE